MIQNDEGELMPRLDPSALGGYRNGQPPSASALLRQLSSYPSETVEIVTEEYGYPQGTGVQELRDELTNLQIDLGMTSPAGHTLGEFLRVSDLWEECEHLPEMYQAMIQRCEWYLEEVPIDVGAKDFGLSTLELLKLIEEDERE